LEEAREKDQILLTCQDIDLEIACPTSTFHRR
jgi:hypothetical protein